MLKILLCVMALFLSIPAHANMGVLILPPEWSLGALIAVIVVEVLIMKRFLRDVSWKRVLFATGVANVVSTAIGIPIMCSTFDRFAPVFPGIHIPLYALISSVFLVCFFVSVWIERLVTVRMLPAVDKGRVQKAVWVSNIGSYVFLIIVFGILFAYYGEKAIWVAVFMWGRLCTLVPSFLAIFTPSPSLPLPPGF